MTEAEITAYNLILSALPQLPTTKDGWINLKILALQEECSRRIQTIGDKVYDTSKWLLKSQNLQDTKTDYFILLAEGRTPTSEQITEYNHAKEILRRKDLYRILFHELVASLRDNASLEELQAYNPKDDAHWESIE
tara:strand:- start:99 stop:506 length:408 start_codon:yes stop_codon:yes gene_type:complete